MACGGECSKYSKNKNDETEELEEPDNPDETTQPFQLFNLAWEDILFLHILSYLKWEDLFRLRSVSREAKEMIDHYFEKMKVIDLSLVEGEKFTLEAFKVVIARCTNVRELRIHNATWPTDDILTSVFERNKKIEILDLTYCKTLKGTCLLALAVNCKNLKTLILRECTWMSQGAWETLMAHLNVLEVLDVTSCSGLTNQIIIPFVQKFSRLREIHIAHNMEVNDMTLFMIAKTCGKTLKILDIRGCLMLEDFGVRSVVEMCGSLENLFMDGCHMVGESAWRYARDAGIIVDMARAPPERMPYIVPVRIQM